MPKLLILISALLGVLATGCASQEPFETTSATSPTSASAPADDRTVIAEAVGNASAGSKPLAWANPETGSAGVIEHVENTTGQETGCRKFTTSQQALGGKTRFDGVACPSGQSWKLSAESAD